MKGEGKQAALKQKEVNATWKEEAMATWKEIG